MIVIEIGCILLGLWISYRKYRIVIGGTICMATISSVHGDSRFGAPLCTVRFVYNGEILRKSSDILHYFASKKKLLGKSVSIIYNERFPKAVAKRGITAIDVLYFLLISVGVAALFYRT